MTYRAKHYLDMRPPLAMGGHCFAHAGPGLGRCVKCQVILPVWAIKESMGGHFGLARWCPGIMRALPRGDADAS